MNYSFIEDSLNHIDKFNNLQIDIISSLNENNFEFNNDITLSFDVDEFNKNKEILKENVISEFGKFKIVEDELCNMEENVNRMESIDKDIFDVFDEGKVNKMREKMEQLKMEKNKLLSNVSYFLNITKKTDIQEGHICAVCYKRDSNVAMIPCGHVFCKECTMVSKNNVCYVCRKTDVQYLQLYYN